MNHATTPIWRIIHPSGRERLEASDSPWNLDLGAYDPDNAPRCDRVRTMGLNLRQRAELRATLAFDAIRIGAGFLAWHVAPALRRACIAQLVDRALTVDAPEDDEPTRVWSTRPPVASAAWGHP